MFLPNSGTLILQAYLYHYLLIIESLTVRDINAPPVWVWGLILILLGPIWKASTNCAMRPVVNILLNVAMQNAPESVLGTCKCFDPIWDKCFSPTACYQIQMLQHFCSHCFGVLGYCCIRFKCYSISL